MSRKFTIAVCGAGREVEPATANARELGRLIAVNGWVLITGGRNAGVMKAANEGAKSAGGLTVGILPNAGAEISHAVEVAIITDTGEARNNIIVMSADVVVACGVDGAGTVSEAALAVKNGKPLILLGVDELGVRFIQQFSEGNAHIAENPTKAIEIIKTLLD